MKESRLKKVTYSIVALAVYQITVFVCNLILPRMILTNYGSEYNGVISSITQFLNFVSILRLGVAGATRVELYKSLGTDDNKRTSAIVRATEIYMRRIASVFVVYVIALSLLFPFFVHSSYSFLSIASLVFIISIGTFAQYFFGITYSTLLQADQKLYIYNVIQIVATIANTAISCVLMHFGFSIQIVKFASALIFTASPVALNLYVSKHYNLDKKVAPDNTALTKRKDVVAHSISNIVHENTDITVLTVLTNLKIVSVYSVYHLVINGLKQLMTIFTSGLESAFGDMFVKKQTESLYRNVILYDYLMSSFVIIIFSCAIVLILPFVSVYTRNVTDVQYIVPTYAYIAVIAQAIYCLRVPFLTVVHAAGHYKETKKAAMLEATINLVSSIILTYFFGIVGVGIGTLVANAFRTIHYEWYLSKHLLTNISFKTIIFRVLWVIITSGVIISICQFLIPLNNIQSWISWVRSGFICFIIAVLTWLVSSLLIYKTDLHNAYSLVVRMISHKRKKCAVRLV